MKSTGSNSNQFAIGFASALGLLCSFVFVYQAVVWFSRHRQPAAFAAFLQAPRFSLLDVFTVLIVLLTVAVLLLSPRYLPRP